MWIDVIWKKKSRLLAINCSSCIHIKKPRIGRETHSLKTTDVDCLGSLLATTKWELSESLGMGQIMKVLGKLGTTAVDHAPVFWDYPIWSHTQWPSMTMGSIIVSIREPDQVPTQNAKKSELFGIALNLNCWKTSVTINWTNWTRYRTIFVDWARESVAQLYSKDLQIYIFESI